MKTNDGLYDPDDLCPYCGFHPIEIKCENCQAMYCSKCIDETKLCPYCSGRAKLS